MRETDFVAAMRALRVEVPEPVLDALRGRYLSSGDETLDFDYE